MAAPTIAEIKARYPALAAIDDTLIQFAIDDADPWFDVCRWDGFYAQGFSAFVAHMVMMDQAAQKAGTGGAGSAPVTAVQSKKVGDVQVSYQAQAAMSAGDAWFSLTPYGQRFLQLRRMVGMGAVAV